VGSEVAEVVSAWRPQLVTPAEAAFARRVVLACSPLSAARARSLLWATSRLARFGTGVGLDADEESLLKASVIERFIMVGLAEASGSRRRTVRSNLRYVGRRVAPEQFSPEAVPVERLKTARPYTEPEIAAYLALAAAQPTPARRMRAAGLICLGAGAGLLGADLRQVRGTDVVSCLGSMCVRVVGRRRRLVPVLGRYREALSASASFAGDGFVLGGLSPTRHNVTHRLVDSLSGGADLGRLSVPRLRASFLTALIESAGLPEVLSAAGLSDSKALFDIVSYLGRPTEEAVVAVIGALGGSSPA
jgi:integrase